MLFSLKYTSKTDVWFADVISYKMLGTKPSGKTLEYVIRNLTFNFFRGMKVSNESKDIILQMLTLNKTDRMLE